jgi:hypothetical protein
MATWTDLVQYVKTNYKIADEKSGLLSLLFDMGEGRSQVVVLIRDTRGDTNEEWVHISSAFGKLESVNLAAALDDASKFVCGGLVALGDLVAVRHSAPLAALDVNEFEEPLMVVTNAAELLERTHTGADDF